MMANEKERSLFIEQKMAIIYYFGSIIIDLRVDNQNVRSKLFWIVIWNLYLYQHHSSVIYPMGGT